MTDTSFSITSQEDLKRLVNALESEAPRYVDKERLGF